MNQSKETQLFMEKLFRFNKLVHHEVVDVTECPRSEYKMLGVIHKELEKQKSEQSDLPGVPISNLSKVLLHSKPATSRILNTLEEKNCIVRIPSKMDRRTVYVNLTETGKNIHAKMVEQTNHYTNQILLQLGPKDTKELLRLMDRLYDIVADIALNNDDKEKRNQND